MRPIKTEHMTPEQLVQRFVEIGLAQDETIIGSEYGKYNRLFDILVRVEKELKSRPGDQRRLLIPLYSHRNVQVRLNAAKATLAVVPQAARQELEQIAVSGMYPQAGDAGMSLTNLDNGIYKPT